MCRNSPEIVKKVPIPPEAWDGVKDATQDCNVCMQIDREDGNKVIGSEDCLYLNVYTPKLPSEDNQKLPVMFFIHGGGFVVGDGTDDNKHGADFIIQKDVVVVSINYRLGIFGFLSLNCKDAPGNMGLRDQVQALKWVQENIKYFNGDPNNVTVFGVSAGGASVEYLLLSPMARGLFHKAISQSGSSLLHWAQNNNIKTLASKIPALKNINIQDDAHLLKYLKELPGNDLVLLSTMVLTSKRGGIHFGYVPTIEKPGDWEPFLDTSSYELLSSGNFTKVPFIGGFCTREGLLALGINTPVVKTLSTQKEFKDHLPFNVDINEFTQIEENLKSIYLESENAYNDEDNFAIDFFTDSDFLGGVYVATTLMAKYNPNVFFYEFAYDGGLNYLKRKLQLNRRGTCHGDDTGYIVKSNMLKDGVTKTDELVRERIVTMWTNFAKTGNPTPEINDVIKTKWENVKDCVVNFLLIDDNLKMKSNPYPRRTKLYEQLYEKYRETY